MCSCNPLLCGIGRSWTDTFFGPSKMTAFIVFVVDMVVYSSCNQGYGKQMNN